MTNLEAAKLRNKLTYGKVGLTNLHDKASDSYARVKLQGMIEGLDMARKYLDEVCAAVE